MTLKKKKVCRLVNSFLWEVFLSCYFKTLEPGEVVYGPQNVAGQLISAGAGFSAFLKGAIRIIAVALGGEPADSSAVATHPRAVT